MSSARRFLRFGLGLIGVGYIIGLLTAPRSGRQTRTKIKNATENSANNIEKELKNVYNQTKESLASVIKDNPKLTENVKQLKGQATKSQTKVKELLSAIHGRDNIDDDLDAALKDAKKVLTDLKNYLAK